MPVNYRWDPFSNTSTAISISNEAHIIPSSSPFTIRLDEVPKQDTPSTLIIKVKDLLAAAITTSGATSITVTNGAWFAVGNTITIDSEQMYVSGIASNVLTVTRGYNGTTATTHSLGAAVYIESSMAEVGATPTSGQFWSDYSTGADGQSDWNTGTILFNAADAGKTVVVSYVGTGTLVDTRTSHGQAIFKESGAWICPEGIIKVFISMCGGGGGGGGTLNAANSGANGNAGGNSSFGSLLTTNGGAGGGGASRISVGAAGSAGGTGGTSGGKGYARNGSVISGCGGSCILGAGGSPVSSTGAGLPGAGFGAGGSGGAYTNAETYQGAAGGGGGAHSYLKQPVTVIPTTEYIITIGAGGVGGESTYNGGNGAPGICIIEW